MHEHAPPPQTNSSGLYQWMSLLVRFLGMVLLVGGGLILLREWHTSTSTSASPLAIVATHSPPASPFVVEVVMPDRMTVVTPEPEPTPVPPPKATPVGIDICTDNTPKGTACKQPPPPLPPPTEIPECPVNTGATCVATGKPLTYLPTPLPTAGYPP